MDIFDPHIHLWDPASTPRAVSGLVRAFGFSPGLVDWLARLLFPRAAIGFFGTPEHATRPFLPATYDSDRGLHPVDGIVHVEAGWHGKGELAPVGETRWLAALEAAGACRVDAIVANANLDAGESVRDVLQAHLAASDRVRGVRDMLAHHPNKGVLDFADRPARVDDPQWRRGFEQLAKHGLRFDAWCYHHQLPGLVSLARAYPDQPIVLCHFGTPVAIGGPFAGLGSTAAERDEIRSEWRASMAALAECPNVYAKLSGLGMPVCGFGYRAGEPPSAQRLVDDFSPLVDHAIEQFGVDRCFFASNFPVDKASFPLGTYWDAVLQMSARHDEATRAKLLRGNARRFYGLTV